LKNLLYGYDSACVNVQPLLVIQLLASQPLLPAPAVYLGLQAFDLGPALMEALPLRKALALKAVLTA
jgi:hypothetical protein